MNERRAGILLPLFSLRTSRDWGVGDFGDLPAFCRWLAGAGHSVLQLLPIMEIGAQETSPYGALTAFGLDPLYLDVEAVEDFAAAGGVESLSRSARECLDLARIAPGCDYGRIRHAKHEALALAFAHFERAEVASGSRRAAALQAFIEAEGWWLESYVLFRALLDLHEGQPWTAWGPRFRTPAAPQTLRDVTPAVTRARRYHAWVQWMLALQWVEARRAAAAAGVRLYGDVPFMVSVESADVWQRQDEFRLDATVGAPPDEFSAGGQDWGLPVMRWDVMAERDYGWWRARCRRAADLFDGVRLDHVVGYYRQYERPASGDPAFRPADEPAQRVLGERLLGVARESGAGLDLIGEDLGSVPAFVRESLHRLAVPGFRVLRWEHDWGRFRDPRNYPEGSVATSGTHDTSPLATWWEEEMTPESRAALAVVPAFAKLAECGAAFDPPVHRILLEGLYDAASRLVILPFMDAYGGRERINIPSTVQDSNWSYRIPFALDDMQSGDGARFATELRGLAEAAHRLP